MSVLESRLRRAPVPLLGLTAVSLAVGFAAAHVRPDSASNGRRTAATSPRRSTRRSPTSIAATSRRWRKAWEWATGETPNATPRTRPGNFQATPLMIGDTLYLSTSYNRVVALDATTGRELWAYDPKAYLAGQPPNGTGFVHRGVATWTDGKQRRIFMNSRWNLIALDAATGKPIRDLRRHGRRGPHGATSRATASR